MFFASIFSSKMEEFRTTIIFLLLRAVVASDGVPKGRDLCYESLADNNRLHAGGRERR